MGVPMSADNPWKTLSSKVMYRNSWISVREDQVIRPDGSPGIYGVVETKVATGVVALTNDNQVWLVGQYRYPPQEYSWEIIEGGAEHGEDPFVAIQRELEEEAGLRAAEWNQLGDEFHLSNCFSSERGMLYLARELTVVPSRPDCTEVLQLKCMPLGQALLMVDSGEIKDSMSIVGLMRAERFLKGNTALATRRLR